MSNHDRNFGPGSRADIQFWRMLSRGVKNSDPSLSMLRDLAEQYDSIAASIEGGAEPGDPEHGEDWSRSDRDV